MNGCVSKINPVSITGEFYTEAQYADQMEGWVSNWYYAGFEALQVNLHPNPKPYFFLQIQ